MRFRQVHADFHTSEAIGDIGVNFDKKQFQAALIAGHVDSITLFSKCHHGWTYHPSKVNEMHPGLKFDLLGAQIEAAHEIGVKTPVYLSAGCDYKYVLQHPEQRREWKDHSFDNFASPSFYSLCMNTPYLDVLLSQIREVLENYDADGIFLDIVGVRPCCCTNCLKDMMARGEDPNDDKNILGQAERVYANYLRRVRQTIDEVRPGLPLFHNSGHVRKGRHDLYYGETHFEMESLPTGGWGYDHFPVSVKYVQNLGMEYLGMTGKFHTTWGEFGGYKHPNALRYEVALSAAMGAKSSIGDQLPPDGHMDMTTYELIGQAYAELEEKEPWLDQVTPICDVAVLSVESAINEAGEEAQREYPADVGAGRILLEGKYLFSVIDSSMEFAPYKVIILPDVLRITDATAEKLRRYLAAGGQLLATGTSPVHNGKFLFDFGAEYLEESDMDVSFARPLDDNPHNSDFVVYSRAQKVKLTDGQELAQAMDPYFNRTAKHFCSHQHFPSSGRYCGPGMVRGTDGIYIAWNIFEDYAKKGGLIDKRLVCFALDKLLGEKKTLTTNLGSTGVVNLMKQKEEKRYIAHLLYATTTRRGENIDAIEDITPVYDTSLSICIPEQVKRVYLAPQQTEIPFVQEENRVTMMVEKMDCHQMVVFDI